MSLEIKKEIARTTLDMDVELFVIRYDKVRIECRDQENADFIARALHRERERQERKDEQETYVVLIGPNIWARGYTMGEAFASLRSQGPIRKDDVIHIREIVQSKAADKPYVDEMGQLTYHKDAEIRGRQQGVSYRFGSDDVTLLEYMDALTETMANYFSKCIGEV